MGGTINENHVDHYRDRFLQTMSKQSHCCHLRLLFDICPLRPGLLKSRTLYSAVERFMIGCQNRSPLLGTLLSRPHYIGGPNADHNVGESEKWDSRITSLHQPLSFLSVSIGTPEEGLLSYQNKMKCLRCHGRSGEWSASSTVRQLISQRFNRHPRRGTSLLPK